MFLPQSNYVDLGVLYYAVAAHINVIDWRVHYEKCSTCFCFHTRHTFGLLLDYFSPLLAFYLFICLFFYFLCIYKNLKHGSHMN